MQKKSLQKVGKIMLKYEHLSKVCKKCEHFGKSMQKYKTVYKIKQQ